MLDASAKGISAGLIEVEEEIAAEHAKALVGMITREAEVGDLFRVGYRHCDALVHDAARQRVGGLPMSCFLLATRLAPGDTPSVDDEDCGIILLRVTGQSQLPNGLETDHIRFTAGQRASDTGRHWDDEGHTDQYTLNQLRYAGVACRVIGTFRVATRHGKPHLTFGADISNFYSGRGMKVYKPTGAALGAIVNFSSDHDGPRHRPMRIGEVRYAVSLPFVGMDRVHVHVDPSDLLARRTALFGMSRTGKSNTVKIVSSRTFTMRAKGGPRIGQLVLDTNGEYANENVQDGDGVNLSALKSIAGMHYAEPGDVVTYGLTPHPNDPNRRIVKINFYGRDPASWNDDDEIREAVEPLVIGKQKINQLLSGSDVSKYIKTFRDTPMEAPEVIDHSSITRYRRSLLVYRAILCRAGFDVPEGMRTVSTAKLFNAKLLGAMEAAGGDYKSAAELLSAEKVSLNSLPDAFMALRRFIHDEPGYKQFDKEYGSNNEGSNWHDDRLVGLLALLEYPNGPRSFRRLRDDHDPKSTSDYARDIVDDLVEGRLVIFDQSTGDPEGNKAAAERIMWALFNRQKETFTMGLVIPDVLVYAEEAHNLLPTGNKSDLQNIWSRVAKEGSKYRIGLVYATQEPSSIQSNILKNTDNWFIAHLNNTQEMNVLRMYLDFIDFEDAILQVPEPGYIRMRTLSNPYTIPVQIERFTLQKG